MRELDFFLSINVLGLKLVFLLSDLAKELCMLDRNGGLVGKHEQSVEFPTGEGRPAGSPEAGGG